MSEDNSNSEAMVTNSVAKRRRRYRQYSDEDKATALAAIDANKGNVKRTARQLGIPHRTLDDWSKGRKVNPAIAELHTRKKGSLADKFENLAHLLVDAMPGKIAKATLSQCAITSGIATDKAIRLRGEGLYPDPATELCQLLGINRKQLPTSLELQPGEVIPSGFEFLEASAIVTNAPNVQAGVIQSNTPDPSELPESPQAGPTRRRRIWENDPEPASEGLSPAPALTTEQDETNPLDNDESPN